MIALHSEYTPFLIRSIFPSIGDRTIGVPDGPGDCQCLGILTQHLLVTFGGWTK